ncbi:MAG: HupE/UreJ family protein [Flavobacteriales bacterium]
MISEGILHITDIQGYDHMLFLLALCAPYSYLDWKKIIWMATAFTVGHSITLALSAMDIIRFSSDLIELLIPITIMITAVWNVLSLKFRFTGTDWVRYAVTAGFGLIHGMGFSTYLRIILTQASSLIKELFLFNLGVEIGQLVIISGILILIFVLVRVIKLPNPKVNVILSSFAFLIAAWLVYGKLVE